VWNWVTDQFNSPAKSMIDKMKKVSGLTWDAINTKPKGANSIIAVKARGTSGTTINMNINLTGGQH